MPLVSVLLISSVIVRNAWDIHNSVLSVLMSYTVAGFVTQIIKITVGRPRPDLIDRASFSSVSSWTESSGPRAKDAVPPLILILSSGCIPAPGSHDHVPGLSNYTICTQTNLFKLNDGFKSFPSGHCASYHDFLAEMRFSTDSAKAHCPFILSASSVAFVRWSHHPVTLPGRKTSVVLYSGSQVASLDRRSTPPCRYPCRCVPILNFRVPRSRLAS